MKKLFLFVTILFTFCYNSFAQNNIKLKLGSASTNTNVNGAVINKGDEFIVYVKADGNGNTTSRALYFDFEFQNTAFQLISVTHTGTGGNGGILPYGSSITLDTYTYPGYSWKATSTNTTVNGNTNYANAQYNYTQGGNKTIIRAYLNWASPNGMPYAGGFDDLLKLRFKLKTDSPGYAWDPIKMNFAAAYNQDGSTGATEMSTPLTSVVVLDPTATKYVSPTIETNSNIDAFTLHRVLFLDPAANVGIMTDATSTGEIPIDQTKLAPDTEYRVMMMVNMDSMLDLFDAAATVSDYTTAQAEFVSQNLDGTFKGQSIITGAGFLAADVNRSKVFDGGDLTKLYGHVIGVTDLEALPANHVPGTDMYRSVPTFTDSTYNAMTAANWKDVANSYVTFKTGKIGENKPLKLKFMIPGDINRSHSSQVMIGNTIATNAVPSLKKNLAANPTMNLLINTSQKIPSIDVIMKNQTITASTIEIPIDINTGTSKLAALQFEFTYDPTKIKFESISNSLPNTWYTFVDAKNGKIKFGSIDKDAKNPLIGTHTPFKLKFTAINNPLDLNSYIGISPNMDAASVTGYQLGINLNTTAIKLTGYNNF
jgi:hypothetical protein